MPVDSFRFVSPGVFTNEIDQSQIAEITSRETGPVVFGVAQKGPALVPTTVASFAEFVDIFGQPQPGEAANGDVWRDGDQSNPTYGAYAAQAYLRNAAPLTFVRLVGSQESGGTTAGWEIPQASATNILGGTYGLFIMGQGTAGSSSMSGDYTSSHGEGVLAAVFHLTGSETTIEITGLLNSSSGPSVTDAASVIRPQEVLGANREFRVRISGSLETIETTFNFDPKSARYIRSVFNTNPHLLNPSITPAANQKQHFLAQTFGKSVIDLVTADDGTALSRTDLSGTVGIILALSSGSSDGGAGDFRRAYATPATPWIIGQDLTDLSGSFDLNSGPQRLFRVFSREGVEYAQSHYKISVSDIKQSPNPQFEPYGSFTLMVRDIKDTDEDPRILEQFNNLNLNPVSNNFVGRRIGDRSWTYDTTNNKWVQLGQYPVLSRFIRLELDAQVENGTQDNRLVPFGFRGLPMMAGANIASGSATINEFSVTAVGSATAADRQNFLVNGGSGSIPPLMVSSSAGPWAGLGGPGVVNFGGNEWELGSGSGTFYTTGSLLFPILPLRGSSADGRLSKTTKAFFGLTTNQASNTLIFDGVIRDLVRINPANAQGKNLLLSPGFSLDDLVYSSGDATHSGSDVFVYNSTVIGSTSPLGPNNDNIRRGTPGGARKAGTSMTAVSASYAEPLDRGFNKFTMPLYGGFNGFDLFEKNPFNQSRALNNDVTKTTSQFPMYYTLKTAIDSVNDVDQIDINLAAMPGITDQQVTDYLIAMAEERKDTLTIIDLESGYTSSTENTQSFDERRGSSAATVTAAEARNFNSSYAAAYYPWVQISDGRTNSRVWVPPSTVALGVLASSAATTELWFAPAGFNRGGLTRGSAGLTVTNVIEKLTADQRDNLYDVNVNPIASFPAEGIVVFGQKTLQATPSALDRINVRRLLIFCKKQITQIANGLLFDPNNQVTWNRFLNQVGPFLASIKNRFGLEDYRVVLDTSTTTPDMVDQNIMYAQILLKPTRAIEFIALDFVISRSGAEFE